VALERIALTGASGLLGRHIAYVLLKKSYKILATSRKRIPIKHTNLKWRHLDLCKKLDHTTLNKTFGKVSAIVHVGAYVPIPGKKINVTRLIKSNVDATDKLAAWAQKRKIHFIYISGAIIYKNQNKINSENSEVSKFSKNKYCNSKILSEKKLLLREKKGLMLTIFRASSIYGWGLNKFKIISNLINLARKKTNIKLHDIEKTEVNLIHAYDVSTAVLKSLQNRIKGIFNVGNYSTKNFYNIAIILNKLYKNNKKIKITKNKLKTFPINKLNVKIDKAKKILNWKPNISLKKGLTLTAHKKIYINFK